MSVRGFYCFVAYEKKAKCFKTFLCNMRSFGVGNCGCKAHEKLACENIYVNDLCPQNVGQKENAYLCCCMELV